MIAILTLIITIGIAGIAHKIQQDAHEAAKSWREEDLSRQRRDRREDLERHSLERQEDLDRQRQDRESDLAETRAWREQLRFEEERRRQEELERLRPKIEISVPDFHEPSSFLGTAGFIRCELRNIGEVGVSLLQPELIGESGLRLPYRNPPYSWTQKIFEPTAMERLSWEGQLVNQRLHEQGLHRDLVYIEVKDGRGQAYRSDTIEYVIPAGWIPRGY